MNTIQRLLIYSKIRYRKREVNRSCDQTIEEIAVMDATQQKVLDYLKSSRYFKDVSDDILKKFVPFTEYRHFQEGEIVMRQGEYSNRIYLIISGSVSVNVSGEHIYDLNRRGDIFGEMSVITGHPVTATLRAYHHLETYIISSELLKNMHLEEFRDLQYVFYRWFSIILSEKLFLTSLKPKEYEKRNHELEQKNTSLLASHHKLKDLSQTYETLLKKLGNLHKDQVEPLQKHLEHLEEQLGDKDRSILRQGLLELHKIQQVLQPISALYLDRQAVSKKRVLLAENNKKQQIISKMALGGTGIDLDIVSTFDEGKEILGKKQYDIICANLDLIELTEVAYEQHPEMRSVFMTSEPIQSYLPLLKRYQHLSNIISRSEEDRIFTIKNILSTVSKLINGELFGMEKYLNWGVEVKELSVTHSGMRRDLIQSMETYFDQLGVRRKVITKSGMVAEELLMNAIYDAPIDANGKQLYNHLSRIESVSLKPEEQGLMRFACDGILVAVSVEDPFGGLDRETIIQYLESCYSGNAGHLNHEKGGAGRGLFYIMEISDLVVINVRPHIKTEVISIFNIDPTQVKKSSVTTSFHYFYD